MLKNFPIIREGEGEGEGAIRDEGVRISLAAGKLYTTPLRMGSSLVDAATYLPSSWYVVVMPSSSRAFTVAGPIPGT
jgi:hypothetical protein